MSDDIETPSAKPSRAVTAWTLGLLCLSIVAGGVIVGGLLHHPEHELTTAPVTTTKPKPEKKHTYGTPPVTYPTQIPGCATVEPPGENEGFSMVSGGRPSYDNPAYPWFSGPKAVAMSAAALDALPDGVALTFASLDDSLVFEPIFSPEDPADAARFGGSTTAHAQLSREGKAGSLFVSVHQSTQPIPACVAGDLDARRILPDGTTVDTHDTWSETDGVRTLRRSATAYTPDGSRVYASADDSSDTGSPSGKVPMTIDELVALATTPGVRVTTPVPPGTPDAPLPCRYWPTPKKASTPIDETTARRLDSVLSRIQLDGLVLDRPLGTLRPDSYGPGVCQAVRVTATGQQSELRIVITVEPTRPTESTQPSRSDPRTSTRTLPDGTVIETQEPDASVVATGENSPQVTRTVVVTRPSGTEVEVSSTAKSAPELLSAAQLEAIASTPDLEVK
ncbi:hypothetical protein NONI108955_11785 [Nocardia ninae]|uniref:Uncharacterized protein n=1 Tax=Nocardia ninae NBRC 108245 TaxID=1210091 RepID=A0A511MQ52_9NOCA|nr:hypothetical protein [Nocardia ninae]GEM42714.1 hypothetical protein NN4_72330 [Nocardia ninae NBRC 108245]